MGCGASSKQKYSEEKTEAERPSETDDPEWTKLKAQLSKNFSKYDKSGDGKLGVKEFSLAFRYYLQDDELLQELGEEDLPNREEGDLSYKYAVLSKDELKEIWNKMDADGDHKIDLKEFLSHFKEYIMKKRAKAEMNQAGSQPDAAPAKTPAAESGSKPASEPAKPTIAAADTPAAEPAGTSAPEPASTPAVESAGAPAPEAASAPAGEPMSTPAVDSASTPAPEPAGEPASTPAVEAASTTAPETSSAATGEPASTTPADVAACPAAGEAQPAGTPADETTPAPP